MADELHKIEGDSPVKGDLLFWNIVGHEGFSRPYAYELTVLSKKKTINPKDILGYKFNVEVSFFDEGNVYKFYTSNLNFEESATKFFP